MKSTVTERENNVGIKYKAFNFDLKRVVVNEYLLM